MYSNPKITFMCVTYNRCKMLQNMLLSFVKANTYENFEWVILEHDCVDETPEFLDSIHEYPQFDALKGKLRIIHDTEKPYLDFLRSKKIDVSTPKKSALAQFGKFRNDIIKQVDGDILIDVPDDHQFLYQGNWCQDIVDIFNDRIERCGKDDVSVITFRTRFGYRIAKSNNRCGDVLSTKGGVEYFVVETPKTHDEWHAISRKTFEKAGLYPQLENVSDNLVEKWNTPKGGDYYFLHHMYLNEKFSELNLKRIMTKLPITHDCGDSKWEHYADLNETIFEICESEREFKHRYGNFNRCMSMEEFERMNPIVR